MLNLCHLDVVKVKKPDSSKGARLGWRGAGLACFWTCSTRGGVWPLVFFFYSQVLSFPSGALDWTRCYDCYYYSGPNGARGKDDKDANTLAGVDINQCTWYGVVRLGPILLSP